MIVTVYGGPHGQTVTDSWSAVPPFSHLLAGRGFLVFTLDNRGTAGRGQAFETPIFRDLGKMELRDQLAGVTYLKSLPFVDTERIAISGWSYGGFLTLYAATHAPHVFRAAVAGAPVADWALYDTIYTERYMGTPTSNPEGYASSAPTRAAGMLDTELLLIHGVLDDNVHFASTVSFVDALTKAGKPYELLLGPKEPHGFASREARLARDRAILAHFERHLKP